MKTSASKVLGSERGSALVITLWVTLILCVIALEIAYATRLELRTLNYGRNKLQASELARSAAQAAIAQVAESQTSPSPAKPLLRLENGKWRPPSGLSAEETPLNKIYDSKGAEQGSYSVEIIDESGKINVNTADQATLTGAFKQLSFAAPAQLARAVISYRESRPAALILSIDELLNCEGFDEKALYGEDANNNGALDQNENDGVKTAPADNSNGKLETGVASIITASPKQLPSLNLAPQQVISAALGATVGQAKELIQLRTDTGGFSTYEQLKNLAWITDEKLHDIRARFSLSSGRYTARASASAGEEGPAVEITASVAVEDAKPSAFLWREKRL